MSISYLVFPLRHQKFIENFFIQFKLLVLFLLKYSGSLGSSCYSLESEQTNQLCSISQCDSNSLLNEVIVFV